MQGCDCGVSVVVACDFNESVQLGLAVHAHTFDLSVGGKQTTKVGLVDFCAKISDEQRNVLCLAAGGQLS